MELKVCSFELADLPNYLFEMKFFVVEYLIYRGRNEVPMTNRSGATNKMLARILSCGMPQDEEMQTGECTSLHFFHSLV